MYSAEANSDNGKSDEKQESRYTLIHVETYSLIKAPFPFSEEIIN